MIFKKWESLVKKVYTIYSTSPSIGSFFKEFYNLFLYAGGQIIAYLGLGNYIFFRSNGYKLYLSKSPVAMVLFGNRKKIREEELFARKVLKEGDIVLDIGANIGNFSLCSSGLVGENGYVYAFEAHPRTVFYAKRNFLLNKSRNIKLFPFALGDSDGEITFSNESYDDVNHVDKNGSIVVKIHPLDCFEEISALEKISLIKIDVEGYELPVLKGSIKTLKKTESIYFEVFEEQSARYDYSLEELFSFLEDNHFVVISPITGKPLLSEELPKDRITNCLAIKVKR